MHNPPRIFCCTLMNPEWTWFSSKIAQHLEWHFFSGFPKNGLERYAKKTGISIMRACFETALDAKSAQPDLLITHDPRVSFRCALFAHYLGVTTEHVAYSFNFPELPRGLKYRLMKKGFSTVSEFIVYSSMEKQLYRDYFDIPEDRIRVALWGVSTPKWEPEMPLEEGDYICAIGGNSRDYATLMATMEKLPSVRLVIVVRPQNLEGLRIPDNVKVLTNIPGPQAMNILKHSRFMVLPLKGSEVPCGHVTLVAAMHLEKAFIITNSSGVSDYVKHGYNSLVCEAFSTEALTQAILELWNNPEYCDQLGINGKQFALQYCSEEASQSFFKNLLIEKGLLPV